MCFLWQDHVELEKLLSLPIAKMLWRKKPIKMKASNLSEFLGEISARMCATILIQQLPPTPRYLVRYIKYQLMQTSQLVKLQSSLFSGKLVPVALLDQLLLNENLTRREIRDRINSVAMELDKEVGRNDITKQVIELKLGNDFIVSKKPMIKRKAQSFSPYSRFFQDLCIQHRVNSFQGNVVVAGLITTSETSEATIVDVSTRSPTLP